MEKIYNLDFGLPLRQLMLKSGKYFMKCDLIIDIEGQEKAQVFAVDMPNPESIADRWQRLPDLGVGDREEDRVQVFQELALN
jgi:hypothetical protein